MAHVDKAEEILIVGNYVIPALVKPRKESLSQALHATLHVSLAAKGFRLQQLLKYNAQ